MTSGKYFRTEYHKERIRNSIYMINRRLDPTLHFFKNFEVQENGCWKWVARTWGGYGSFKANGNSYKAHRFSYEYFIGQIPEGLSILHTCGNSLCVNSDHLFLGTQADNMQDCSKKGRLYIPPKDPITGRFISK